MTGSRLVLAVALTIGLLAAPLAAEAQPARIATIGWLAPESIPALETFRVALRELGRVEGQNVLIEAVYVGEAGERLPERAAELVRLKVEVIVALGTSALLAARRATTGPIVSVTGDPVAMGLVGSLAHPGGNVTGVATIPSQLNGKRLELLKGALPHLSRLAVLNDATGSTTKIGQERMTRTIEAAARSVAVQLLPGSDIRRADDFAPAFARAASQRADAVFVQASPYFNAERERIVRLAAHHRLPAVYEHRDFPAAGGLMSYGPDWHDVFRRVAVFVDKILKGAKPGDLPVEQPTKFELVINLKTAKALGLTIPPSLLARADEIIEQ
jgi:putative ABC transport system substrate-binding protein